MKKLGALAVIFFVAAAGGYFFNVLRAPKRVETKDNRLVACDPARIKLLRLVRTGKPTGDQTVEMQRTDTASAKAFEARVFDQMDWALTLPVSAEADVAVASRLAASLCETTDQIPVTDGEAADIQPANTLVAEEHTDGGVKQHTLHFASRLEGRQVRVWVGDPKEKRVFKVLAKLAGLIDAPAATFQNRKVARTLPNNVMQAAFSKKGKDVFTLDRNGADWQVVPAGRGAAQGSDEAEKYVNRVANLMALEVLSSGGSSECEEKAVYRLAFAGIGGKKEILSFSAPGQFGGKKGLLACSSLRKTAFLVHGDLLKYLDVDPKRLVP